MSTATQNLRLFGRAWKVTISNANGIVYTAEATQDSPFLPEPLRITFDTYQTIQQAFWYCDISIYNLNAPTEQEIITQGMQVTLEGGYQSQPYGILFQGTVFQPIWTRENGTDFKLTLHCLVGLIESSNNFLGLTVAGGVTQRQIVAQMAASCHFPLNADNVDALSSTKVTRASTFFGQPGDFLQNIADENNANLWFSNMALNIRSLRQSDSIPTLIYSPGTGLIGTPQQTQDGVLIQVLLDPRASLMTQIQLAEGVVINQLSRRIPSYPTILDQNGLYIIGAVRHHGDSRGNEWYSDITGFVNAGSLLSLQTGF